MRISTALGPALGALSLVLGLSLLAAEADAQRRRRRPPAPSLDWFAIVSEGGMCLDAGGARHPGQGVARMQPCNAGPSQRWRFEGSTLVSAAGGCLEVPRPAAGQRRGSDPAVRTGRCHGGAVQRWQAQPNGALVSAGRCLDVEGAAIHAAGTRAIAWPCHGRANQRFRILPVATQPNVSPPPPARRHPMDAASFEALIGRIRGVSFSSERVATVGDAAPHAWFTAAQIARIVGEMSFSSERAQVIELLAPRLLDRQNGGVILDRLTFSSERESARQVLARYAHAR